MSCGWGGVALDGMVESVEVVVVGVAAGAVVSAGVVAVLLEGQYKKARRRYQRGKPATWFVADIVVDLVD